MEGDTLKDIIVASNVIRRKFKSLKHTENERDRKSTQHFKPVTESLVELKKAFTTDKINSEFQSKVKPKRELIKEWGENESEEKKTFFDESSNEPSTSVAFLNTDVIAESEGDQTVDVLKRMLSTAGGIGEFKDKFGNLAAEYITEYLTSDIKNIDKKFGIRFDKGLKIGDARVSIDKNDLIVKDRYYEGTSGLYELLCKKNPDSDSYTDQDLKNYLEIVEITNAHRIGYRPEGRLNGNGGRKYKEIIKPAFSKTGGGLLMSLTANNKKSEYVYWNDPNELVDRYRLLTKSKEAGHTNHDNEIISIIEELREAGIIV